MVKEEKQYQMKQNCSNSNKSIHQQLRALTALKVARKK